MTLWALLVLIVIVGVILWLVPGIDPTLRKILIAVVVIGFVLWLLAILGVFGGDGVIVRTRSY